MEARQSFVNITKCNVKSLCVVTTFIMLILSLRGQKDKKTSLSIRVGLKNLKSLLSIRVSFAQSSLLLPPREYLWGHKALLELLQSQQCLQEHGALLEQKKGNHCCLFYQPEQSRDTKASFSRESRCESDINTDASSSSSNIRNSLRHNRSEQQQNNKCLPHRSEHCQWNEVSVFRANLCVVETTCGWARLGCSPSGWALVATPKQLPQGTCTRVSPREQIEQPWHQSCLSLRVMAVRKP